MQRTNSRDAVSLLWSFYDRPRVVEGIFRHERRRVIAIDLIKMQQKEQVAAAASTLNFNFALMMGLPTYF